MAINKHKLRGGTAAEATAGNVLLEANEIGIETDTFKVKIGPGYWNDLSYLPWSASAGAETDPVFVASAAAGIDATDISHWDAAYGWGNHASAGYQATSGKDATGGYAGLTLFKINFKNALNTFTSFFANANTAARTYTFQDRNGTIADDTDITAAKARANHTGTQTASTVSDFNTAALAAAPAETTTTEGALINGATAKSTPVDADFIGLMDSAASNILKKLSWANVKATLKTYFDTLYINGSGSFTETKDADLAAAATIAWDSTAPSGTTNSRYSWTRIGNTVFFEMRSESSVAGVTNTQVTITIPPDMPTPESLTGFGASEIGIALSGYMFSNTTGIPLASRSYTEKTGASVIRFVVVAASNSAKGFIISGHYHV